MAQALLQSPDGSESAPRWFGAVCLIAAIALAGLGYLPGIEAPADTVELVKAFLWPATIALGGAKVAEALKK